MSRTRLRQLGLLVLLALIAVLLAWFLRPTPATSPVSPVTRPAAGVGGAAGTPAALPAEPFPAAEDDEQPEPATPLEEAHAAVYPERTRIRCAASGGLADATLLRFVPRFPFDPKAELVQVHDGDLTAVVDHPYGDGVVQVDGASAARLEWWDAYPGRPWGACAVHPVRTATVTGTVTSADGAPAAGAKVRGCEQGTIATTDPQGRFELELPRDRPCSLAAIRIEDAFGAGPPVDVGPLEGDLADVVLHLPDQLKTPEEQRAMLDNHLETLYILEDALAPLPTVFDEALARDDLSAEARARIEAWAEAHDARSRERKERLERLLDEAHPEADLEAWLQLQ